MTRPTLPVPAYRSAISPTRNPEVPPASWPYKRLPDDGTVDLSSKMLAERLAKLARP